MLVLNNPAASLTLADERFTREFATGMPSEN
jgi:hypothetical protein